MEAGQNGQRDIDGRGLIPRHFYILNRGVIDVKQCDHMCWTQVKNWRELIEFRGDDELIIKVKCDLCGKKGEEIYEFVGVEE